MQTEVFTCPHKVNVVESSPLSYPMPFHLPFRDPSK